MIPLVLRARNYRSYPDVEFHVPAGLTAVVGVNSVGEGADSNGSGKTTLLELLPVALFGPRLPWIEYLAAGSDDTSCSVEVEFQHGEFRYLIRRTFDAKGRGKTTLDFERLTATTVVAGVSFEESDDGSFRPTVLTMNSQAETQRLIEKTIGLSLDSFDHSVYAGQGARHFADPDLPPRERKAILAEALNLGVWDDLAKLVKADIASVEAEDAAITARLGAFDEDLSRKDEIEAERPGLLEEFARCSQLVDMAEESVQIKTARLTEAKTASERLDALRNARDGLSSQLGAFERQAIAASEAVAEAQNLRFEIATLKEKTSALPALEAEAQELAVSVQAHASALARKGTLIDQAQAAGGRREKARAEEAELRQAMVALAAQGTETRAGARPCGTCGQPLTGEALEKAVASIARDIEALTTRAAALDQEALAAEQETQTLLTQAETVIVPEVLSAEALETKREALRAARAAVAESATLTERLATAERTAAAVQTEDFQHGLIQAREDVADAEAALAAAPQPADPGVDHAATLKDAEDQLRQARAARDLAQTRVAASDERLRSLAALAERSQDALAERGRLQARLEVLTALSRSYGRDGIPALILEATAIPQIEVEANRVLDQLGARMRFELVTQRENKGGGIKDTLDVVVHGEKGALSYQSYSGGEQTRLGFALRIALARLIAAQRGAQAGVLILDELAFLDGSGIGRVCEVLRGLTEFRSILLVSHDDRFVDAFDQVVTVTRDEQGSRITAG